MRPAASLERGYRRLLRCYPAGHRDVHGEEMLGVLLAGARPGQRRPGLPESASLICGAVRIRLRGTWPDSSDRWRDTLAQTSLVLPLLIAAVALTQLALHAPGGQQPAIARWLMPHLYLVSWNGPEWWPLVPLAALAVPAALGWRQGTGFVALPLAALCAIQVGSDMLNAHRGIEPSLISPGTALWLAVLAIEALALAASPGPRRGRALLSCRHYLLIIAAGVAIGAVGTVGLWYHRVTPGGYSTAFRPPWPALVSRRSGHGHLGGHADPARRQPPPAGDAGPPGLLLRLRRRLRLFLRARPAACLPAAAGALAAGRDPDEPALVPPPPPRAR